MLNNALKNIKKIQIVISSLILTSFNEILTLFCIEVDSKNSFKSVKINVGKNFENRFDFVLPFL